jgi:hypothetical protein
MASSSLPGMIFMGKTLLVFETSADPVSFALQVELPTAIWHTQVSLNL